MAESSKVLNISIDALKEESPLVWDEYLEEDRKDFSLSA